MAAAAGIVHSTFVGASETGIPMMMMMMMMNQSIYSRKQPELSTKNNTHYTGIQNSNFS
jgi:hypothetical protein